MSSYACLLIWERINSSKECDYSKYVSGINLQ
jgi:hypothetical protein